MYELLRRVWLRMGATIALVIHDVGEAVYLSRRVYGMQWKPGRIVE